MHDQMPVRVLHRFADIAKQSQSRSQRQVTRARPRGKRQPIDVLHRDPRRAIRQGAGVIQMRDARMIELRQCALFACKPFASRR